MKKLFSVILSLLIFAIINTPYACAIANGKTQTTKKVVKTNADMSKVEIAMVFDSNSEKTNEIIKKYRPIIEKSLKPEYQAVFANDLIFKGNWNEKTSQEAAKRALLSRARMIICFGYWSGEYLKKNNKTKNVITVDQFAIRGFSDKFFNPVQQSVNDLVIFKRIVPNMGKTAIFFNERIYKSKNNWNELATKGFKEKNCNIDFVIIPLSDDVDTSLKKIPADVKTAYITQIYNLSSEKRKQLYDYLKEHKIPSFSSMGKDDVELGAMLGTSTKDLDKKLAEQISFSIRNVIKGGVVKNTPLRFVDENVLYYNKDTGEAVGYIPHVRLLKSAEIITAKRPEIFDLSTVFTTFEERNLSIKRKKYLVSAAKRSLTGAYLKYLPATRIDLGYQTYDHNYAYSYSEIPQRAGSLTFGIDQMIYSPDLVTNIIVKHKKLKFDKAEKVLTEQNIELQLAQLYIEYHMLKNIIKTQKQYLDDVKNALAMAKVRKISGKGGTEEILRLSAEISNAEKILLLSTADFDNLKIHINQMLHSDQTKDFDLAPIRVTDPAFFLSDINIIDYIRTPDKMEKFIELVVDEAIYLSPETTKLKAAISMKKAEIGNYAQKFVLPNSKLTYEWGHQFGRELPYYDYLSGNIPGMSGMKQLRSALGDGKTDVFDPNSQRFMIMAQWKPIEGGTKIAEIARCKSELNELKTHLEEVNEEIELNARSIINRAIAKYLCIERSYKALAAEEENLVLVKEKYVSGKVTEPQMLDALKSLEIARLEAANAQYEFFNELIWLQRCLVSVNWASATDKARSFIDKLKKELVPEADINVNL